jgi:hypothetical protein
LPTLSIMLSLTQHECDMWQNDSARTN